MRNSSYVLSYILTSACHFSVTEAAANPSNPADEGIERSVIIYNSSYSLASYFWKLSTNGETIISSEQLYYDQSTSYPFSVCSNVVALFVAISRN